MSVDLQSLSPNFVHGRQRHQLKGRLLTYCLKPSTLRHCRVLFFFLTRGWMIYLRRVEIAAMSRNRKKLLAFICLCHVHIYVAAKDRNWTSGLRYDSSVLSPLLEAQSSWNETWIQGWVPWGMTHKHTIRKKRSSHLNIRFGCLSVDANFQSIACKGKGNCTDNQCEGISDCRCKLCSIMRGSYEDGDYENVAYNKPHTLSSSYEDSSSGIKKSTYGCGALNGQRANYYQDSTKPFPNCFRTSAKDKQSPWFFVDLLKVFTFQTMRLNLMKGNGLEGQMAMANVDVLVDGRLCYQFARYTGLRDLYALELGISINCKKPETARMVLFQKMPGTVQPLGNHFLMFCELQIWVCKPGKFGEYSKSCQPCPDQCKYTCDSLYGCNTRVVFDIALLKQVTLTSIQQGQGHFLVDGERTSPNGQRCVRTMDTAMKEKHTITVRLGSLYKVYSVTIYSRVDCCSDQELRDFSVTVRNLKGELELCLTHVEGVPIRTTLSLDCLTPKIGTEVAVTKTDSIGLSMCELQVFGHEIVVLMKGSSCQENSEVAYCIEGSTCSNKKCRGALNAPCFTDEDCVVGMRCDRNLLCKHAEGTTCTPLSCMSSLECDAVTKKCISDVGRSCQTNSQCSSDTVCDVLSFCKLRAGQNCKQSSHCVAGASCSQGRCACNTYASIQNGPLCSPVAGRIGSTCSDNGVCISTQCVDNKCTCPSGQSVFSEDFSCKLIAGAACSSSSGCNTGLVCENGQCKIGIGEYCHGNEQHCTATTTCESGICTLSTGESCAGHEDQCSSQSTCSGGICKVQLGQRCENAQTPCVGICSASDNNTCKLDIGMKCIPYLGLTGTHCRSGTICDTDLVCKLNLGEPCTDTENCRGDTVCGTKPAALERKCRLPLGAVNCINDEECVDDTVCDNKKYCRLGKNVQCRNTAALCLLGATCDNGQCQCNEEATIASSTKCDPKPGMVGGACGSQQPCSDERALCGANNTCECIGTYSVNRDDLTCGIEAGFPCSADQKTVKCISGATCVDGVCVLQIQEPCQGSRRGNCRIDTLCDSDGLCRLNLNKNCVNYTSGCRIGTVCDFLGKCRRYPGKGCSEQEDCMAGAFCNKRGKCECNDTITTLTGDTCVPVPGVVGGQCVSGACKDPMSNCSAVTDKCECRQRYSANPLTLSCAKMVGRDCKEDGECVAGLVCDPAVSKCRIQLGHDCDGENEESCETGLVCDFDSVCKLDMKGNCNGTKSAYCRSGIFCDVLNECRVGVGDSCNASAEESVCIAGAKCLDDECVCDDQLSTVYGAICEPVPGRYGGACEAGCSVANSLCVQDVCGCQLDYYPDREFKCMPRSNTGVPIGQCISCIIVGVIVGTACFCLAVLLAIILVRRLRHKQAARRKLSDLRAQSMVDMGQLQEAAKLLIKKELDVKFTYDPTGYSSAEASVSEAHESSAQETLEQESTALTSSVYESSVTNV